MKFSGREFNPRPLFFVALFLSFGIIFSYFRETEGVSPWWVLLPVLLAFFAFLLFGRVKLIAALLLAFLFGVGFFAQSLSSFQANRFADGVYLVEGRVVERSLSGENAQVKFDRVTFDKIGVEGLLIVYLPPMSAQSLRLGDRVQFTAKTSSNPNLFNDYGFRAEAISEKRRYYANGVTDLQVTGRESNLFLAVREEITQAAINAMDDDSAAVTIAILLGDTTAMDGDLLSNIRSGGIAHIFAVSGLHIGTLFAGLVKLFSYKKSKRLPRFLRFFLVAGALLFYGGVCGYSSSVVRATVTCLTLYLTQLFGGKTDGVECTSLAGIIVLFLKPTQLFAIGFQLSFLACYGIVFLSKNISGFLQRGFLFCEKTVREKIFKKPPHKQPDPFDKQTVTLRPFTVFIRKISVFLGTTLAAQAFTFPAMVLRFGGVAELGLLLNCIFVPLLSVIFCPLLAFALLAAIFPALQSVILYLPDLLISVGLLPFETFTLRMLGSGTAWGVGALVCYYAAALCVSDKINLSKKSRLLAFFACFASLIVCLFV